MSNKLHTPTPWKLDKAPISKTTCIFGGDNFMTWICGKFTNTPESNIYGQANAQLIVTAVNSHEAMREALIDCISQFGKCLEEFGIEKTKDQKKAHKKAIAALALSEVK